MKAKLTSIILIVVLVSPRWLQGATEPLSARSFAGADGKLDRQKAALYLAHRDKEPLAKFVGPGQTILDTSKVVEAMADKLDDLRSTTGHEEPWTWEELDHAFPPQKSPEQTEAGTPAWKHIEGITKKKQFAKDSTIESIGPFLVRKSADDITKSLSDSKGATLAYSRNGLKTGSGAINSEGILDYPTLWDLFQGGKGKSLEMGLDFATQWKVAQVQDDRTKDVEQLTFLAPFTLYCSPGASQPGPSDGASALRTANAENHPSSRLLVFQAKPYFLTDFGFRDRIYGIEANAEFVGNVLNLKSLYLGGFQNLGPRGLQYQARLIPKIDYSITERGGIHTSRKEGDDWFRVGGLGSLDLRLGLKSFNALDAGISYQLLQTVSGSGGYSYLFKTHCTLWLLENVGATIEYSKGDTPIADKPINLVSFGIEFKF